VPHPIAPRTDLPGHARSRASTWATPPTPRGARLHPEPQRSGWHDGRPLSPRRFVTYGTAQAMQLSLGHRRRVRWNLPHLMPLGRGILARQEMVAVGTALGLDRDDDLDLCAWPEGPRLPLMTALPARSMSTRLTAGPLTPRLGRIARRRPRRGPRVLLQRRPPLVDRGLCRLAGGLPTLNGLLPCSSPCLKRSNVGLSLCWDALPHLWRYGSLVVHTLELSVTSALTGTCFAQGLHERLQQDYDAVCAPRHNVSRATIARSQRLRPWARWRRLPGGEVAGLVAGDVIGRVKGERCAVRIIGGA
jgi:hypothetical protein